MENEVKVGQYYRCILGKQSGEIFKVYSVEEESVKLFGFGCEVDILPDFFHEYYKSVDVILRFPKK